MYGDRTHIMPTKAIPKNYIKKILCFLFNSGKFFFSKKVDKMVKNDLKSEIMIFLQKRDFAQKSYRIWFEHHQ